MDAEETASTTKDCAKAKKEMENIEKAREREFYRYYRPLQRPKADPSQPSLIVIPPPNHATPEAPFPSDDKTLTAFAQLGALRLNTRRCLISFFDRKNCYILAEATQTLSLQTGEAQSGDDKLAWGNSIFPKQQSICYYTVSLPVKQDPQQLNDYGNVPTLVVNDLSCDNRFKNYPFVAGYPHSRFYAGVPIRSPSGHSIGTYCVLDDAPRDGISAAETAFLKDMAVTVMRHLEMMRTSDDHRRRGVMVRSLGSFAEGKSSLEDWWHDPWDAETPATEAAPETGPLPRQRRQTLSSSVSPKVNLHDPFIINSAESVDSNSPSVHSANPASPGSGFPGSTTITPASEILSDARVSEATTKTASSAKDDSDNGRQIPELKTTFARAADMICQATEADAALFFDAKVSTFGGLVDELVDDEFLPEDNSAEQDKPCAVFGASPPATGSESIMGEAALRHLLRTYPHGQIFNFDDDTPDTTSGMDEVPASDIPTPLKEASAFIALTTKRPESSKSQDDENLLKEAFPRARSLLLYPLWDTHRDRWFAGAILWTSDPKRVFTTQQELSYLAAFSNSIMSEVARLDTKLADAAKGDFISSISHELRSPLHGILGSCELLKDTQIDTFQNTMAQTIETCGKTLLDTINHVLDFAKINNLTRGASKRTKKRSHSTKHIISPAQSHTNDIMTLITDVDLNVLTEEVLETVFSGYNFQKSATQVYETLSHKSDIPPIAVIVDINKSDNYVFRTQPGAWRRVLMNLFGNALKYTPAGYIKVKLQVTASNSPQDELCELRLTISDSGIGMSEDYVNNRLFHSFAQEDPLSQGTGLGLCIVKQIVESLGGDIEVLSKKNRGTKFTVYCPVKLSTMSPAHSATNTGREIQTVRMRTEGMNVSFIGFDEEGDYFPVKSLKNKNATMLAVKALDNLLTDWFGMKVQKDSSLKEHSPDLFVATEAGAKLLRSQYSSQLSSIPTTPVIVVCQGAASAQSTTAITVPGQIFECISQPCGPHKLAKALTSCLDRHATRVMVQSTETGSTLPPPESLNLKENTPPISPGTLASILEPQKPTTTGALEPQRPPMTSALSAPEVRSVNSSPVRNARKPNHRPLHCLAVDDNPINLRLLRTFIEKLHHKHTLATNGQEALTTFKATNTDPENRIDVVLMDINMPEMDGLEATRQIRAHERDAGLPPVTIIALTGVASSEAQQEAHVSGVNLFLIKPVRLVQLGTVLEGVVLGNKDSESQKRIDDNDKTNEVSAKDVDSSAKSQDDTTAGAEQRKMELDSQNEIMNDEGEGRTDAV